MSVDAAKGKPHYHPLKRIFIKVPEPMNIQVPFLDLKTQYLSIQAEIDDAIHKVLLSSQFILGQEVESFEAEFARYCDSSEAVAVNSGTSALHLALLAAGVKPGDEVITVPFTFVATVAAIEYTGATPVFVDIDHSSYTIQVEQIESAITEKTKAIVPVHLYGQSADMDAILATARKHNLIVIEDAAQAHGATYRGRKVGSLGDIGCFSFYPGKNLGAYGEGGIAVTSDPGFAEKMRILRNWGQRQRYYHSERGFNYRMDGLQGAILRVKLKYIDKWTEQRCRVAKQYDDYLGNLGILVPEVMPYSSHVYHIYALRVFDRASLQTLLQGKGVQTGIHYPIPVHLQEGYRDRRQTKNEFPHSEIAANEVLSLPIYPEMTQEQVCAVCKAVEEGIRYVKRK
jgi:dTDP-4-amino-4,6-dideoxygalactose transaminase